MLLVYVWILSIVGIIFRTKHMCIKQGYTDSQP